MEPVSLSLGTVVAKWVLRAWLKDSAFEGFSDDLIELVRGKLGSGMEGRRASRQFEQLAEHVADRIDVLLQSEFRNLAENERSAAAASVKRTLETAIGQELDPIALDLEPTALERRIRELVPEEPAASLLSSAGDEYFDFVLQECCACIVVATMEMPDFESRALRELLSRDRTLIDNLAEVLDRLSPGIPSAWGEGSQDDRFTERYRRAVISKYDSLQLFGVQDPQHRRPYPLSVAYISLSASAVGTGRKHQGAPSVDAERSVDSKSVIDAEDFPSSPDEGTDAVLRVEAALTEQSRIIVAGGAGSGKTTLIQWIAVTASKGKFTGQLTEWNEFVPFIIPLRRYVDSDFPAPEGFINFGHNALREEMPSAWANRVLLSGKAIVLIDGLDELPGERRNVAREWLAELLDVYPDARYIVTSRPLAVSDEWQHLPEFAQTVLQPMQISDIRAFVSHWHRAVESVSGAADVGAIRESERNMLAAVQNRPAIRTLCTSPLLCALICAMHQSNVNRLPENRMDLYRAALRMLISDRDDDRRVASNPQGKLTFDEARSVLAHFAAWMHENGHSDTSVHAFEGRVHAQVNALARRDELDAEEVARGLLERSGVLRQPVEGRVDFVHRTFLEYLAAEQFVDDNAIPKLISHAHLDQWREVTILAAGHCNSSQRDELLRGLIDRAEDEPGELHRLYLLAVACRETCAVLAPDLQTLLSGCLDRVLPPANMTEAAAVASAGSLAVDRLATYHRLASEAAPCVRALSLIGTEEALEALATFGTDDRVTVTRQLIRAWGQFDGERYAKEVLAESPLDYGHLVITDPDLLRFTHHLRHLESIFLDAPGRLDTLDGLPQSAKLRGLNASYAKDLASLVGLGRFPNLRTCWVENSRSLTSLNGIEDCPEARNLYFSGCTSLVNISAAAELPAIRRIQLGGTAVEDLSALGGVPISDLNVYGVALRNLGPNLQIQTLSLGSHSLSSFEDIAQMPLEVLRVATNASTHCLVVPDSVTDLSVHHVEGPFVISGGDAVQTLSLDGAIEDYEFDGLSNLADLSLTLLTPPDEDFAGGLADRFEFLETIHTWGPVDDDAFEGFYTLSMQGKRSMRKSFRRIY